MRGLTSPLPQGHEDVVVVRAVREEGGWRLQLSEFVAEAKTGKAADETMANSKALKAAMEKMNASYEDFAKQIKAGKYATRQQAARAFTQASRTFALEFYRTADAT